MTTKQKALSLYVAISLITLALYPLFQNNTHWGDEAACAILLFIYLFAYRITQNQLLMPLIEISQNATPIRRGEIKHRIPLQKQTELSNIAKTINRLSDNIRQATEFIKAIEQGDLHVEYQISEDTEQTQNDQLANALKNMQLGLQKINQDEKERNWTVEGLTLFSDIMREHNQDFEMLNNQILSQIIEYTGATQGGIFITDRKEEDTEYLHMISCYAYNRKKYLEKTIQITDNHAEGLIGQAYLNGKTIYLSEVPTDYLQISSALGDISPQALLIVPLQKEDQIIGVLEIASLSEFAPYQIEFVEKIAESLTSTLIISQNNQKTKQLLRDSQEKEEALRAQEEEMRQNMEELQATQEEMKIKQKELEIQNKKREAAEIILQKALGKSRRIEQELKQKNAEIAAQEEEMRQNMEELQATQEEMSRKQKELEVQNKKRETAEVILQKALEKSRGIEQELKQKNAEIAAQEEEMRQNMEELQATQEEMEKNQTLLKEQNQQMENDQKNLKEQIAKNQTVETTLRIQEKKIEANANILRTAIKKYKEQIKNLKEQIKQKDQKVNELKNQ